MLTLYAVLKLVHLIGAAVLFGTGAGIAFFMFWADRTGDVRAIAAVARIVVVADMIFTASAVVAQPLTGAWLAYEAGYALNESWILLSLGLYVVAGLCWLPVLVLQVQMRDLAVAAAERGEPLPAQYTRAMRRWFWLGWPAFTAVLAIYWLMITKPDLF